MGLRENSPVSAAIYAAWMSLFKTNKEKEEYTKLQKENAKYQEEMEKNLKNFF